MVVEVSSGLMHLPESAKRERDERAGRGLSDAAGDGDDGAVKTSTHVRREGLEREEGVVHTNVSRGPVGRYRLGGDHARAAGVERGSDEGVAVEGCAREREEPLAGAE